LVFSPLAKAKKDQDVEWERVKKAVGEMKRKLDMRTRSLPHLFAFLGFSW